MKKPEYFYKVTKIVKIVDGDTADVEVDTGFHHKCTQRFRLSGIDTPERGEPGYKEAGVRLMQFLELYKDGNLFVESEKTGSFNRWLGTFYGRMENGELFNINIALVEEGYAQVWIK